MKNKIILESPIPQNGTKM